MTYSKAQDRAQRKWVRKNYDHIQITAPKGFNARLTESAKQAGKSKRQYIIEALEKEMGELK